MPRRGLVWGVFRRLLGKETSTSERCLDVITACIFFVQWIENAFHSINQLIDYSISDQAHKNQDRERRVKQENSSASELCACLTRTDIWSFIRN